MSDIMESEDQETTKVSSVTISGEGVCKADANTAFLLGNGPSLKDVSLPDLSNFITIGMNAAYRYWREIDWYPSHYACLDTVVGLSHKEEIAALIEEGRIGSFLLRDNLIEAIGEIGTSAKVINFDALRARKPLLDPKTVTTGSHAALWAASLGCDQIIMLGIDGNYQELVEGAERGDGIELEIVEEGDNPNYFFDGYQQKGDRYNVPNPRPGLHVEAWGMAGLKLASTDVQVFNANARSEVRYFPFISLKAFLGAGANPAPAALEIPPHLLDPPLSAAPGRQKSRLAQIADRSLGLFRRQFPVFALGAIGLLTGGALTGGVSGWAMPFLVFYGVFAAFSFGLLFLLLFTRDVVIQQLGRLQADLDGQKARIADVERRDEKSE